MLLHRFHPCHPTPRRQWLAGMARLATFAAVAAHLGAAANPLPLAAVPIDINHASEADLDSLDGVGPALTARILAQRAQAPFEGWPDLMRRVKGVRQATAQRLAAQGVRVNGQALAPAPERSQPSEQSQK
jgi:competence protein ComEA